MCFACKSYSRKLGHFWMRVFPDTAEWTIRFNPYHTMGQYMLGNGYARKNYSELQAAYPGAFSDEAGRKELVGADEKLAAGDRSGALQALAKALKGNPKFKQQASVDHDLDVLRSEPGFAKLLE